MEKLGAVAKCAPPLRAADEQEKLWARVLSGEVDTIGSDHSPSPPGMKTGTNFFQVWGGISGVQHTLPLLLSGAAVPAAASPLAVPAGGSSAGTAKGLRQPGRLPH